MLKITDYLIYVKEMNEFNKLLDVINNTYNYKHQYGIKRPCGSVVEVYNDKVNDTKAIIGTISIYDIQQEGINYLIENKNQFNSIYEFVDNNSVAELISKYPKILQARNQYDWGYEVTKWYTYPVIRELNYDRSDITCYECFRSFKVCGSEEQLESELLQCPHCKSEIEIEVSWTPILTGKKVV